MSESDKKLSNCNSTDNSLKNWTSWLEKWRKVKEKMAKPKALARYPEEMLMSNLDHVRADNEEKEILEYAKISTHFDKYRGKPDFWKLPLQLQQKSPDCLQYFAVKTKPQQYIIPTIELVGFPELILRERNVLQGARNMCAKWQQSEYRSRQFVKYSEKISNIVPHKPSMDHLVVVGRKIDAVFGADEVNLNATTNDELESTETEGEISVEQGTTSFSEDPQKEFEEIPKPMLEFKLNGISFSKDGESLDSRKLHLKFEHDLSSSIVNKQSLFFENSGRSTLRIYWTKKEKHSLFQSYTLDRDPDYGFCFNKNELLILPGHVVEFPIWFRNDRPGSFSEKWEIFTYPKLWDDDKVHVVLALHCYSYYKNTQERLQEILEYVHTGARNLLIKNILNDMTAKLKYKNENATPCIADVAELFESTNSVHGRATVLFNSYLCTALKQFYRNVSTEDCSSEWNFSITDLKLLAKNKDIEAFLNMKKQLDLQSVLAVVDKIELKQSAIKAKNSKASKKSDKVSKKESKTPKVPEKQPETLSEPFAFEFRTDLDNIIKQLDYTVLPNRNRLKYMMCVQVMSAYFTKMTNLLSALEDRLGLQKVHRYPKFVHRLLPVHDLPARLIYEDFDCNYISVNQIALEKYSKQDQPKANILEQVSNENIEKIYAVYFNKPYVADKSGDTKDKKGKGKKEKEKKDKSKGDGKDKGGKKGKKDGKSSKQSGIEVKKPESIIDFDPYDEIFTYEPATEESVNLELEEEVIPCGVLKDYKLESYLIVYNCLDEAVCAMVDTLNMLECSVPLPTLDKVLKCPESSNFN